MSPTFVLAAVIELHTTKVPAEIGDEQVRDVDVYKIGGILTTQLVPS